MYSHTLAHDSIRPETTAGNDRDHCCRAIIVPYRECRAYDDAKPKQNSITRSESMSTLSVLWRGKRVATVVASNTGCRREVTIVSGSV